jgi:NAD(P)-dependent dehydrogenase (short-subunit alcohol dehydrogenase family)/acyl carrier protein
MNGFTSAGAYLVTGGTGPVGQAIATMIAQAGGGHIVLLSRSGRMDQDHQSKFVEGIRSLGANVHMLATDVSNADAVAASINWIEHEVAPLRGVFHAAGLLDDAVIDAITRRQLEISWNAKAAGAENLAHATRHIALDHFVLISSISSLIGNPGQGSYCAANGFLNGVATQRRQSGLPGLAICLGPVGASGMAANVQQHLSSIGFEPYSLAELPDVIKSALTVPHAVIGLARFDPAKFLETFPTWRRSSRNVATLGLDDGTSDTGSFANLLHLDDEAATEAISAILADVIADTLKTDRSKALAASQFSALGMDSLLAIEAQLRIEDALGVRVSTLDLLGECGVHSLATSALATLRLDRNNLNKDGI